MIKRALALRCLEIPVGDFISEAMKGDLPDVKGCKELLESNVVDEENHDIALSFAASAHGVPDAFEKEADRIKKAWLELDRSADIYRDEQTHVAANTLVCEELGLKSDKQLNALRRATVGWVTQSLKGDSEHKHLSSNFWMSSSDSLYTRGKAEGLLSTRASRMPAFFETNNVNLPQYA